MSEATCFATEAARIVADQATAGVRGVAPIGGLGAKTQWGLGGQAPGKISGFYVNFRPKEHL